jgi:hypothetical protein
LSAYLVFASVGVVSKINFGVLIGTNPLDAWMNDPLARTTELAFVDITALATVDAVYVPPDIVSVAVLALFTPAAVAAVMLPVIVSEPVLELFTPTIAVARIEPVIARVPVDRFRAPFPPLPAVTFPVIVVLPTLLFCTPLAAPPEPPNALPLKFNDPPAPLFTPCALVEVPPVALPVTVSVPVPLKKTAVAPDTPPPVGFPTMLAVAGDAAEKTKQGEDAVADLFVTFAVNVTPLLRTYVPVPALLNSVQVTFAVIVMV